MSDELEKRLRELCDAEKLPWVPLWARLFTAAARIGAEIEREECAVEAESCDYGKVAAKYIRARGGK